MDISGLGSTDMLAEAAARFAFGPLEHHMQPEQLRFATQLRMSPIPQCLELSIK